MNITLPHHFEPRDYQLPFLRAWDNGSKRMVLVWHRRSGKDKTAFANLPKKMFEKKGAYFYFAPTYSQCKKIIWDGMDKDGFKFIDHIPKELIAGEPNKTDLKIDLVNGSYVQLIGTDNIDTVVGTNPIGCIFTEYSLQNKKAWEFVRPILAENGGWAVFIFTPRGMNHGWQILQTAQENPEWFWQVLTVEDTQAISKETLDQEKREMPSDLYEQEYMCKFVEGASQFFRRINENMYHELPDCPHTSIEHGVDLAKYQDWTVVTPYCLLCTHVLPQDRFNHIDWAVQKPRISANVLRYASGRVKMDGTGVGDPICEDLSNEGLPIESFKFTEQSRKALLDNLMRKLAQDFIKLPPDEGLLDELRSFQYSLSENGKLRLTVPDGTTDDRVMSLALAVWDTPDQPLAVNRLIPKQESGGLYDEDYK